MDVSAIFQRASELGITLRLVIQYTPKSVTPPDLIEAMKEHKTAIIDLLRQHSTGSFSYRVPTPQQIGEAINELRPHLPVALRRLDNERLLALINWSILVAWEKAKLKLGQGGKYHWRR